MSVACNMYLYLLGVLAIGFASEEFPHCDSSPCGKGQFKSLQTGDCEPCPRDMFMNLSKHRCTTCMPCTRADFLEAIAVNCTADADAVIHCKADYYRPDGTCWPCSKECGQGEVERHPCGPYADRGCQKVDKDEKTTQPQNEQGGENQGSKLLHAPLIYLAGMLLVVFTLHFLS